MAIQLIEPDAMRIGRGGGRGKSAGRYSKYKIAIQKIVPFLKENIEKTETIRVKVDDLKKEMGGEFVKRHETSIYWGLKCSLFQEGIWVTTGKHNDGSAVLVMREATPEDKLPESLLKGNEGNEGDEGPIPEDEKEDEKDPIDPIDEDDSDEDK